MEIHIVKNALRSCKTSEVLPVLKRWTFLNKGDVDNALSLVNSKQSKRITADEIAEFANAKGGLTGEKAGDLDLLWVELHSQKKQWHVYRLEDKQENKARKRDPIKNVLKLRQELNQLVKLHFRTQASASLMLQNGILWGRVYLPRPNVKVYQASRCLYFVYYPQTPVVLISGHKTMFSDFLSKCLMLVLGYPNSSISKMGLCGHHVESLAKLAINKHMKGGFTTYQLSQRPGLPLDEIRDNKRKVDRTEFDDSRISNTNIAEKRRRLEILEDSFGEFEQPTLEKVEFDLKLHYRGKKTIPKVHQNKVILNSQVKFSGPSVLEGLRNLAASGLAKVPLPQHLQRIPQRAGNYFVLQDSQKISNVTASNIAQSSTDD